MNSEFSDEYNRACRVMPGGVNSPVRAFKGVGGVPVFIERGQGAYIYDIRSRRYLDFVGSWGPLILGHCHADVQKALSEQLGRGTSFGAPTNPETEFASMIIERVPGLEMIRLVNSGTEATMSAIRLARGLTAKNKIIKCIGNYHGHGDSFLIEAGSGMATFGVPSSPGVPPSVAKDTIAVPYNDPASVERVLSEHDDIAAMILEPVAGNMGCIPPRDGYLQQLRKLCSASGVLLIFDEVMTGFRVSKGGAAFRFGVEPDIFTFGKVIGGGMPLAAYGGKREMMRRIAPSGPIYQAGTLSGNPLAVAAGIATLQNLDDNVYQKLEDLGKNLEQGLRQIIDDLKQTWTVNRVGSMITLFFTDHGTPPADFADVSAADMETYSRYFHAMLERGFYLPPSGYESWFLNAAMEPADIDAFLKASANILQEISTE